jgi:hypothetical protein
MKIKGGKTRKSRKSMRKSNPWQQHIKKTMKSHRDWSLKEVLKHASKTYHK